MNDAAAAQAAVTTLLAARAPDATICPSEAARLIAGAEGNWREAMPQVHQAVDAMQRAGSIALSWKGRPLAARAGPYRIARPS